MSDASEALAHRITAGHPHVREFASDGVRSEEDLKPFIAQMADSQDTRCFVFMGSGEQQAFREADVYYHDPSNTAMVDPRDTSGGQEATMFKPRDGAAWFDKKLDESQVLEGRDIEVSRGIQAFETSKVGVGVEPQATVDQPDQDQMIARAVDQQAEANVEALYSPPPVAESPAPTTAPEPVVESTPASSIEPSPSG